MNSREHAENLVRYFDNVFQMDDRDIWKKGRTTAQKWLQLIDAEQPNVDEVHTLLSLVHANKSRSSGWYDLALGTYSWAKATGIEVQTSESFFNSGVPHISHFRQMSPVEQASLLHNLFQLYQKEDPKEDLWKTGLDIATDWLDLLSREKLDQNTISSLVAKVFSLQRDSSGIELFHLELGVIWWCKSSGFTTLLLEKAPENFLSIINSEY